MRNTTTKTSRIYLICMMVFWLIFGLITTFYPRLMELFQTEEGIQARTAFSNHIWLHDGMDIFAVCILLFSLARQATLSPNLLRAAALASLMPAIAIAYSLLATPYWNPLFIGAGLACLAFVIWGFILAGKYNSTAK